MADGDRLMPACDADECLCPDCASSGRPGAGTAPGQAVIGQSHSNKRSGTTTLLAALNVGSGEEPIQRTSAGSSRAITGTHDPSGGPQAWSTRSG